MSGRATATFELPLSAEKGVRCARCASRVCAQVEEMQGVLHVECDPRGEMRVDYDPDRVTSAQLGMATERFGAQLAGVYAHATWHVTGLD